MNVRKMVACAICALALVAPISCARSHGRALPFELSLFVSRFTAVGLRSIPDVRMMPYEEMILFGMADSMGGDEGFVNKESVRYAVREAIGMDILEFRSVTINGRRVEYDGRGYYFTPALIKGAVSAEVTSAWREEGRDDLLIAEGVLANGARFRAGIAVEVLDEPGTWRLLYIVES